ncbi:MAG TPA: hypothetical protein VFZ20_26215, partial [Longimicrobium sp.]
MHPASRRRAGYTIAEVIGAVLLITILLAMAGPDIAHALRVRRAEAVLRNDLHNAANVWEQAYMTEGRYPAFDVLLARGLPISSGIAVDSQAVTGERVYLRLRHVATGQLCALDYSRSSAVARNKSDCYAGGQERDTALALTPELPPAPSTDTFRIEPPSPPDTAENDLALASPGVDNPAAQTALPGEARTQTFMVVNRSPIPRTFRFETGSSSPAVVPAPGAPEPVTLPPGIPRAVPLSYQVASDALADASSVIPLRVIDAGDERWSATGTFTVSAGLLLANPSVELDGPAERVEDAGQEFEAVWTVTNRTNAARVLMITIAPSSPGHVRLVSVSGAGRRPFAPGETRVVRARLRLATEVDGGTRSNVVVGAFDAEAPAYRASAALAAETRAVLAPPVITPPAARTADPGTEFTLAWTVRNVSNQARNYQVSPAVANPSHLEIVRSSGTGPQAIARGEALEVAVTYRVRAGALSGQTSALTLSAVDREAPVHRAEAAVTVGTNTVLAAPQVSPPGAQSARPGEELVATWTVRNATNAPRVLTIEPTVPDQADVAVVSAAGAGEVTFGAFEARPVTVRYRVREGSLAGSKAAPVLAVNDKLSPAHRTNAAFEVTTAADVRDPVLSAPADLWLNPGSTSTVVFRLTNRSNLARTFTFTASTSNAAAVADPAEPRAVTLPAFASADVLVQAAVPAGAIGRAQGTVVLGAVDSEQPARTGEARFLVTVNTVYLPPSLTWKPARSIRPGSTVTDTAMLVNRSNVPVEFCFRTGVAAGSAAPGAVVEEAPAAPPCSTVTPAGTSSAAVSVPIAYTADADALAGQSNVVTLAAEANAPDPLAASATLAVTAELVLQAPVWDELPPTPLHSDQGDQRQLGFVFRNTSNGERKFCVDFVSADPEKVKVGGSGPRCGIRVRPRETFRLTETLHALRASPGTRVSAVVYDEGQAELRAEGTFHTIVRDVRPVAEWVPSSPVYVRKWATFDASRSQSPIDEPIVRYIWTWGLFMQRWDPGQGRFVYTGTWETARDEETVPVVRRAYDVQGTFEVCLTVVDAAGRSSDPTCRPVTTLRPTSARLAWRYRGWWTDQDWCLDVWWDNQCDREHGNARWEIDLGASAGDVPIKQAYAVFRVALHNTDDPDRPATITYTGNSGTTPAWGTYSFAQDFPAAVGKAQDGRWRVLSTTGTAAFGWPVSPSLAEHPLVLNVNLADATGAFDGGPHWVPDAVWITLHVQDAYDRWTSASAYRNHDKGAWRRAYDTIIVADAPPTAAIQVAALEGGRYRATGSGESADGRVVDR